MCRPNGGDVHLLPVSFARLETGEPEAESDNAPTGEVPYRSAGSGNDSSNESRCPGRRQPYHELFQGHPHAHPQHMGARSPEK